MNEKLRQRLMHLESDFFHPRDQQRRFQKTKRAILKAKHYAKRSQAQEMFTCLRHALTLVHLLEGGAHRSKILVQEDKVDRYCRTLFILNRQRSRDNRLEKT